MTFAMAFTDFSLGTDALGCAVVVETSRCDSSPEFRGLTPVFESCRAYLSSGDRILPAPDFLGSKGKAAACVV
jgi:hypothetical protein